MKILFLHGWQSTPGALKPTYLKDHGHEVLNPALPDDDFDAAVRIAQAEYDQGQPDVVVGSSRGGAVAMNIDSGETPLVLLCPAWKTWGTAMTVKPNTIILHSRADETVRRATAIFQDRETAKEMLESLRLCRNRYVHAGQSVEEPDQIVYMVKRFVEPHLFQLIDNTFDVASLEEYAEYLSITRDAKTLDKRLRQLSKVRRMLKK